VTIYRAGTRFEQSGGDWKKDVSRTTSGVARTMDTLFIACWRVCGFGASVRPVVLGLALSQRMMGIFNFAAALNSSCSAPNHLFVHSEGLPVAAVRACGGARWRSGPLAWARAETSRGRRLLARRPS